MAVPVVVDNCGDLLFFASKEQAERYLEAEDVENGEFRAYDSEGRLLTLEVVETTIPIFFGLLKSRAKLVKIESDEQLPMHANELNELLSNYLARHGGESVSCETMNLRDNLDCAIKVGGFTQ